MYKKNNMFKKSNMYKKSNKNFENLKFLWNEQQTNKQTN